MLSALKLKPMLIAGGVAAAIIAGLLLRIHMGNATVERLEGRLDVCHQDLAAEEGLVATLELDKELLRETIDHQNASIEAMAERAAELASRADERAIQVLDVDTPAAGGESAEDMQAWWDEHVGP